MKINKKQTQGFTLVELLVVIAIIAILAALSTPMVMKVLVKSKVTAAKTVCRGIENAVNGFENDYSYLPYDGAEGPSEDTTYKTDQSNIIGVLMGDENVVNYNQIQYFKMSAAKNDRDGVVGLGSGTVKLYDKWGSPYTVTLDSDLDDKIKDPFADSSEGVIRGKTVIVYSPGPEKKEISTSLKNKDKKLIPSNFLR